MRRARIFSNGTKLLGAPGANGKLTAAAIRGTSLPADRHSLPETARRQPTQSNELGTSTNRELEAHKGDHPALRSRTHMDGARFANAVASLGLTPQRRTWQAGIDVLCFGRHQAGQWPIAKAVIFFNRDLAREFRLPLQTGRAARFQDAILAAGWSAFLSRGLAQACAPRETAAPPSWPDASKGSGSDRGASGRGQRRLRSPAGKSRERPARTGLGHLQFHRGNVTRFMCSWQTTGAEKSTRSWPIFRRLRQEPFRL